MEWKNECGWGKCNSRLVFLFTVQANIFEMWIKSQSRRGTRSGDVQTSEATDKRSESKWETKSKPELHMLTKALYIQANITLIASLRVDVESLHLCRKELCMVRVRVIWAWQCMWCVDTVVCGSQVSMPSYTLEHVVHLYHLQNLEDALIQTEQVMVKDLAQGPHSGDFVVLGVGMSYVSLPLVLAGQDNKLLTKLRCLKSK